MDELSKRMDVLNEPLMESCQADCHGFSQHNTNQTMEEACGEISEIIIRGDENFKRYVATQRAHGVEMTS